MMKMTREENNINICYGNYYRLYYLQYIEEHKEEIKIIVNNTVK